MEGPIASSTRASIRPGLPTVNRTSRDYVVGLCALSSGLALVICILSGAPLRLMLLLTAGLVAAVCRLAWITTSHDDQGRLRIIARAGLLSGFAATVAYDMSKFALARWDSSPYNPFEAIRLFGILLAGPGVAVYLQYVAGTGFHLLNGVSFAIAYCFLLGHRGIAAAVVWALFLELCQVALYPGWVGIAFYREFLQISAMSHLVYGLVLGVCARYCLDPRRMKEKTYAHPTA